MAGHTLSLQSKAANGESSAQSLMLHSSGTRHRRVPPIVTMDLPTPLNLMKIIPHWRDHWFDALVIEILSSGQSVLTISL